MPDKICVTLAKILEISQAIDKELIAWTSKYSLYITILWSVLCSSLHLFLFLKLHNCDVILSEVVKIVELFFLWVEKNTFGNNSLHEKIYL